MTLENLFAKFNGEIKFTDVDIPIDYWEKKAPFVPVLKDWKRDAPGPKSFLTEIIETEGRRTRRATTTLKMSFGTFTFESTVRYLTGYVAIILEDDPVLINIYSLRSASNMERFFALRIWTGKFPAPNIMHTEMEVGFCSAW
jgi:hypothetical protein